MSPDVYFYYVTPAASLGLGVFAYLVVRFILLPRYLRQEQRARESRARAGE